MFLFSSKRQLYREIFSNNGKLNGKTGRRHCRKQSGFHIPLAFPEYYSNSLLSFAKLIILLIGWRFLNNLGYTDLFFGFI